MEKENSFSLMIKNSSEDISQEKVIKLILQNLIEKYSLEKIINDMVALSKENVNSLIIKDKNPSNPGDIISILYKKVGSAKIFQHLLDIYNDGKEIPKINKNDINLEKKEKLPNNNNIFPPNSSIEEENPQINIDINAQNNANNYTEIIIESESEKEDQNANIIALDENEINPFGIENRSKSFSRKGKKK